MMFAVAAGADRSPAGENKALRSASGQSDVFFLTDRNNWRISFSIVKRFTRKAERSQESIEPAKGIRR